MPRSTNKRFTGIKDKKIRILTNREEKTESFMPLPPIYDVFNNPIWANYRSLSGNEYSTFGLIDYQVEVVFTVNWHPEIKSGMSVRYRDKLYKIVYIDDLEGYKADIKLYCEGGNNVVEL